MYHLYYVTENLQIETLQIETLDDHIKIPQNLSFIAVRNGINFINEPSECLDFTPLERLSIAGKLDDISIFQNHTFRKANSFLKNLCKVDPYIKILGYFVPPSFFNGTETIYPAPYIKVSTSLVNNTPIDFYVSFNNGVSYVKYPLNISTQQNIEVGSFDGYVKIKDPVSGIESPAFFCSPPLELNPFVYQNEMFNTIAFNYPQQDFNNIVMVFLKDDGTTFTTQPLNTYLFNINGEDSPRVSVDQNDLNGSLGERNTSFYLYMFPELYENQHLKVGFTAFYFKHLLNDLNSNEISLAPIIVQ